MPVCGQGGGLSIIKKIHDLSRSVMVVTAVHTVDKWLVADVPAETCVDADGDKTRQECELHGEYLASADTDLPI